MPKRKSKAIHPSGLTYEGQWNKIPNPISNKVASIEDKMVSSYFQFKHPKVCLRCFAATLGPWHYYENAGILRQHMRECIYPFNTVSMKNLIKGD